MNEQTKQYLVSAGIILGGFVSIPVVNAFESYFARRRMEKLHDERVQEHAQATFKQGIDKIAKKAANEINEAVKTA